MFNTSTFVNSLFCFLHRRRNAGKFGIGSACIGGGQGIAVLVEAL